MFDSLFLWSLIWISLFIVFLFILYKERDRKLYLIYFFFGMIFGFYFDFVSFTFGYYSYPDLYLFELFGIPLSMTIAEGFSVVITIKIFEKIKDTLENQHLV